MIVLYKQGMKIFAACILVFVLFSCKQEVQTKTKISSSYFDLSQYFSQEALRLNKLHPKVNKTVFTNGSAENKTITIKDWQNELAVFKATDINKSSWAGLFKEHVVGHTTIISTLSKKIPVKRIEIERMADGHIAAIKIYKFQDNYLYQSADTLTYFPDSSYEIKNHQKIRLLKEKVYRIIGKF